MNHIYNEVVEILIEVVETYLRTLKIIMKS